MPTASAIAAPTKDARAPVGLTSRPRSAAGALGLQRRLWSPPPTDLFPPQPKKTSLRRPMSSARSVRRPDTARAVQPSSLSREMDDKLNSPRSSTLVATTDVSGGNRRPSVNPSPRPQRRASLAAEAQLEAISRGSPKRLSQVTWNRLKKANDSTEVADESLAEKRDRRRQLTHDQQLKAAAASRRDAVRSAQVQQTLRKQDVDIEDVRPLIEIAYWSPFLEVRRDAAAALASLSRNPANLDLLSDAGTLGALLSMLSVGDSKVDPSIARDCAQTLASMAKLDAVKLKILQAPDGFECVFALLHSPDLRLRCVAFELVNNLVTVEELRQAIAKREGFAFMLESCASKDSRVRLLAAAILNHLAESRENRFLFYHSTHFQTLADILHDPFIERDSLFRRELLSFIHLLLSEEENGRKFVELSLIPTLLLILDSPKATHQICVLVVSILEALSSNRKNHSALVEANALPRVVQLCFCSSRGLASAEKRPPAIATARMRPQTASGAPTAHPGARVNPDSSSLILPKVSLLGAEPSAMAQQQPVVLSAEVNALLRPAFTVFCEMAKNPLNRDHVIRSKLVDYITARNLYAASDKRVRRAVITLLTFLICKERERDRDRRLTATSTPAVQPDELLTKQQTSGVAAEAEFKHYIELLARGIIKCLFGILSGNDFSMKVDAIAAVAQLTEDEHSRITMCKPPLLHALKEFAYHPLIQTRTNIAKIIANFAERPENILKLVDEGMLAILVKYVCPISRNNDVLVEATRAIAAMSTVHVTRNRLVESGVLGTLLQFSKSPSTSPEVQAFARTAIRNLRHDAAALCIQAVYRGWCVRMHHARAIITRKRRVRKMTSTRKLQLPEQTSFASVMERFAGIAPQQPQQ